MVIWGRSHGHDVPREPWECVARVLSGGPSNTNYHKGPHRHEVASRSKDGSRQDVRDDIADEELQRVSVKCGDADRLRVLMMHLVHVLVQKRSVQQSVSQTEEYISHVNAEIELPRQGPGRGQILDCD